METKSEKLKNLVEKIKMAEDIYEQAAEKVSHDSMKDYFHSLAKLKGSYLDKMDGLLQLDTEDIQFNLKSRLKLEIEKISIEIDSIFLRLNQGEILSFCVKREEELISMYHNVLSNQNGDQSIISLLNKQMDESMTILEELKEKLNAYDFET